MRARKRPVWNDEPSLDTLPRWSATHTQARPSRLSRQLIVPVVVGMLLALSAAAPATARGTESSLELRMVDPADTVPNAGDQVTFEVTTPAAEPFVNVRCSQGDALVFDAWAGFFEGAWFGQTFTLSSTYWESGGADCRARLVKFGRNGRERVLATMRFHVYA